MELYPIPPIQFESAEAYQSFVARYEDENGSQWQATIVAAESLGREIAASGFSAVAVPGGADVGLKLWEKIEAGLKQVEGEDIDVTRLETAPFHSEPPELSVRFAALKTNIDGGGHTVIQIDPPIGANLRHEYYVSPGFSTSKFGFKKTGGGGKVNFSYIDSTDNACIYVTCKDASAKYSFYGVLSYLNYQTATVIRL